MKFMTNHATAKRHSNTDSPLTDFAKTEAVASSTRNGL